MDEQLELEEQDRIRRKEGLPDWEVRFEPGELANPLVSFLSSSEGGRKGRKGF